MKFTKEQKGITLLALIITIIVLLILAGVALNTLFGSNGIISNSKYAQEEYIKSAEKDAITKAFAELKIKLYTDDSITAITAELVEQQLNEGGNNVEVEDGENGNFVITFLDTGNQYEVTPNGGIVGEEQIDIAERHMEEVVLDLGYTGKEETIILEPGIYKLEAWGAQGGGEGGYGSYSAGTIELQNEQKIYMNVGGKGQDKVNGQTASGGYNGGGNAINASGGGGASHIATVSGKLSELVEYKGTYSSENETCDSAEIWIVAGGGRGLWKHRKRRRCRRIYRLKRSKRFSR